MLAVVLYNKKALVYLHSTFNSIGSQSRNTLEILS